MSSTWEIIKEKKEAANKIASDMGKMVSEKRGAFSVEEQTKFDTMSAEINKAKKEIDNLNSAIDVEKFMDHKSETRNLIGRENSEVPEMAKDESEKRSKAAFGDYLRYGMGGVKPEYRSLLSTTSEVRNLTAGGIGVVGTREFGSVLFDSMKNYSGPLEAGAYVFNRSDGNPFTIMTTDDTANVAAVVAEGANTYIGGTTPEYADVANDPTMIPVTLTPQKYSSKWILLSTELLQDNAFNAEAYIASKSSQRIGRKLNTDFTAELITATVGSTTAANSAITYVDWLNFIGSLNYAYRKNKKAVKIELADTTLTKLRSIVDTAGRPIFLNVTNPQEGVTELLDGFEYVINDDLDAFGAGANIGLIADHSQACAIASVNNPIVVRAEEKFIDKGMIGFITFSRHDYTITDGAAIRRWKVHA